jgi:hypothetical protein
MQRQTRLFLPVSLRDFNDNTLWIKQTPEGSILLTSIIASGYTDNSLKRQPLVCQPCLGIGIV